MTDIKRRKNSWSKIPDELLSRFLNAILSVKFVVSFLIGLFFIGGMGFWVPYIFVRDENIDLFEAGNLFTYGVAILGAIFIEFALSKEKTGELELLGVFFGLVALILCFSGFILREENFDCHLILGCSLAILLFLFANVNDSKYDSEMDESKSTPTGFEEASAVKIQDKEGAI